MGVETALVGDDIRCATGAGGDLRYFLGNLQTYRVTFVDLRTNTQFDTHILALDGIKCLAGVFHRAADNKGYVLTHDDFRFFVIQRQQARSGQDVTGAVALQRVDQQTDLGAADGTDAAQGGTVRQGWRRGNVALQEAVDAGGQIENATPAAGKVDHPNAAILIGKAPLHAQLSGPIGGHLGNHRLDQYLGPTDIQLANDLRHFPAQLRRAMHDDRVGALVGLDAYPRIAVAKTIGTAPTTGTAGRAAGRSTVIHVAPFGDTTQHFGNIFSLGVAQIVHLGVALIAFHVEAADHRPISLTPLRVAQQHQSVGALIGDHANAIGVAATLFGARHIQTFDDAHQLQCGCIFQRYHFEIFHRFLINTLDQTLDAANVGGSVGDDQRVGLRRRSQMTTLGHQWPQNPHQLAGIQVANADHMGNELVITAVLIKRAHFIFLGLHLGNDAHCAFAARHGSEAVGLQHAEKQVIQFCAFDRLTGHHVDLPAHARINNEVDSGFLTHNLDQAIDVRIAQVQYQLITAGLVRGRLRSDRATQHADGQCQR